MSEEPTKSERTEPLRSRREGPTPERQTVVVRLLMAIGLLAVGFGWYLPNREKIWAGIWTRLGFWPALAIVNLVLAVVWFLYPRVRAMILVAAGAELLGLACIGIGARAVGELVLMAGAVAFFLLWADSVLNAAKDG